MPGFAAAVLVVEPDREVNRFICEVLAATYRVDSAYDGRDGLERALALAPDLVVIDIMMPGGDELVRTIRSHRRLDRTPIVLLTEKGDEARPVRLLQSGVQDYVAMPFTNDELRARIDNLITARRALEIQARLAALIELAPDGIFVADHNGYITEANTIGCEMLGYTHDELVQLAITDLIRPADLPRVDEAIAEMATGRRYLAEWILVGKHGTLVPLEMSAKLLPDGRWQAVVHDLRERKRAEAALRASEAKFAGVIAIAADAIISIDDDRRVVIFNASAETMFGWKHDDIVGKPFEILIPERFRTAHRDHVASFAAEPLATREMGARRAIWGLRANGLEFPAEAAISRLDLGAGAHLFTVVIRDVTERTRTAFEQKLLVDIGMVLASTLEHTEILDHLASVIVASVCDCCVVHLVKDGELRRLRVAHRDPAMAAQALALESVSLAGATSHVVASALATQLPIMISVVTPEYLASIAQSEEHLRALHELAPTSLMWLPLVAHGQLLGALSFVSTTTRRFDARDLELARDLAQRASLALENARLYHDAQNAMRARDDVLGIVAHDLRSPLNTILLLAELLGRSTGVAGVQARTAGEVILRATRRMDRLIQELLDVARIQDSGLVVVRARVRPDDVVREVEESQRLLLSQSAITVKVEIAPDLPDVWADRERLVQAMDNLVRNAIKFTRRDGQITVGATQRSADVMFWVSDTGEGIAAESLPHLFERFWQARRIDRRGAGLGLTIVKGIVDAHGGRIWVESTLGTGTTFFFTCPIAQLDGISS